MNRIAKAFVAAMVALPVVSVGPVAADSVVRVHSSNIAGFERFLPALPADIGWLVADRRARPPKHAMLLPEAGSADAWMLSPRPAEAWSLRPTHSSAPAASFAGM